MKSIALIGGDRRFIHLERLLKEQGYSVQTLGLQEEDEKTACMGKADVLLFAYPFSVRSGCVPALNGLTIHPEDVLKQAKPDAIIVAGRGLEGFHQWSESAGFEERNADISAEAAVCEAMNRLDRTLMDSHVLVIGYGKFGRAIALRLKKLGADVTVAARRHEVRMQAYAEGMRAVSIGQMGEKLGDQHLIINTVPARVMTEEQLSLIHPDAWLLETASAPYGFDPESAKKQGIRFEILPALPARYAPVSAAMALRDAALEWMEEAK